MSNAGSGPTVHEQQQPTGQAYGAGDMGPPAQPPQARRQLYGPKPKPQTMGQGQQEEVHREKQEEEEPEEQKGQEHPMEQEGPEHHEEQEEEFEESDYGDVLLLKGVYRGTMNCTA